MPVYRSKKTAPKKTAARKPKAYTARPMIRYAKPAGARTSTRRVVKRKSGGVGSALGTAVGTALGAYLGGPAGAAMGAGIGKAGGNLLGKIFGSGDYQVSNVSAIKQNSLVQANANNIPQFGTGRVAVNFTHREFLGDVFSASTANTFKIDSYPINPGQSDTFPWLSGVVGAKFQQYRINGMWFEFRTMSADALNNVNTALGSVVMSTDYDSADATFTSKQQMENTEYGVSCKPSVCMLHAIECARSQTPVSELYIRAWDVPPGKDIRLYDLGRFSIATTGVQGTNVNLGELWVTYNIDCFKAIEQPPGYLIPFSYYALAGVDATHPFGTSQPQWQMGPNDPPNQIPVVFESSNRFSFPDDTPVGTHFKIQYNLQGSEAKAFTWGAGVFTTGNGLYYNPNAFWQIPDSAAFSTDIASLQIDVEYKGGGTPAARPYVNIPNFTWAPTQFLQCDLYITQISGLSPAPGLFVSQ